MDERVRLITRNVKKYDPRLYATRVSNGMIQIHRKVDRWELADIDSSYSSISRPMSQFILALTDSWTLQGSPVEWGVEPIMATLRSMDSWRDDRFYENMTKARERLEDTRKQSERNDLRARACDMRRDFARATNDINTSTLEKVDNRR